MSACQVEGSLPTQSVEMRPKAFTRASKATPVDAAVATSSAYTWPTGLSCRLCLKRISLLSPQGVTKWMHSCAATSMRILVIASRCCRMEQRPMQWKRRSRVAEADGSMVAPCSTPVGNDDLAGTWTASSADMIVQFWLRPSCHLRF